MEILFLVLIGWLICGFLALGISNSKGNSGCLGFLLGFILGPLGIIITLLMSRSYKKEFEMLRKEITEKETEKDLQTQPAYNPSLTMIEDVSYDEKAEKLQEKPQDESVNSSKTVNIKIYIFIVIAFGLIMFLLGKFWESDSSYPEKEYENPNKTSYNQIVTKTTQQGHIKTPKTKLTDKEVYLILTEAVNLTSKPREVLENLYVSKVRYNGQLPRYAFTVQDLDDNYNTIVADFDENRNIVSGSLLIIVDVTENTKSELLVEQDSGYDIRYEVIKDVYKNCNIKLLDALYGR